MKSSFVLVLAFLFTVFVGSGCQAHRQGGGGGQVAVAPQWEEVELVFESTGSYENPYTDVLFYVVFSGPGGEIRRPGFWDGGNTWRVRFTHCRRRLEVALVQLG